MGETKRNWIVIAGTIVDSARGGGFEFFGPFTYREAMRVRSAIASRRDYGECLAIELLCHRIPERLEK